MNPEEEAQYMQRCRVAAKYFLKFSSNLKILIVNSPYYDLFVEDTQTGLTFGVKVIDDGYLESDEYNKGYIPSLMEINFATYSPRVPIALLNVDETSETGKCGIILSLDWKGVRINYPTYMKPLNNKEHFIRMMNDLSLSDYIVRSLRDDSLGILKTISFKLSDVSRNTSGRDAYAKVVYRRHFSPNYKMNSPRVISEEDQFHRLMHGIPEHEYPSDFLDDFILRAIGTKFEIINKKSSIFLFNSELRQLKLEYGDKETTPLIIQAEPTIDRNEIELLNSLITCPRINLTIYIDNPFFKDLFSYELITVAYELGEWKEAFETIMRLKPTLTDLSKIIN